MVYGSHDGVLCWGAAQGQFRARGNEGLTANARAVYREHYAAVKEFVKGRGEGHRLLKYQPGSGWEPLCGFLGVEVPEGEFPRVNESRV